MLNPRPQLHMFTRPHTPALSLAIAATAAATTYLFSRRTTFTSMPSSMSTAAAQPQYTITPYHPRHKSWPYSASDFTRSDSSPDTSFYGPPRFVTHIDDAAITSLQAYYATVLPTRGRILDFCSSWISHYPPAVTRAATTTNDTPTLSIVGMGMNAAELSRNPVFNAGRIVHDLNTDPVISASTTAGSTGASSEQLLDASTCVVSIDYLIHPVEVLTSLRARTRPGGSVHLAVSNRCFPTKVVARWLRVDEDERLLMVGDYLHFAGWTDIEIVDVKSANAATEDSEQGGDAAQGKVAFRDLFRMMGMSSGGDPLWVVRARNGASKE